MISVVLKDGVLLCSFSIHLYTFIHKIDHIVSMLKMIIFQSISNPCNFMKHISKENCLNLKNLTALNLL